MITVGLTKGFLSTTKEETSWHSKVLITPVRVFNSRTRIVKENFHIRFSENTPNAEGSGPDWLFDIDALRRTMNYEPIVAERTTADPPFSQDPKSSHDDGSNPSKKEDNVNNTNNFNATSTNKVNVVGGKTSIELLFDPDMPALYDYSIFDFIRDDEDDGVVADMNNLDTTSKAVLINLQEFHKRSPLIKNNPKRQNGDALKKCILKGPYTPSTVVIQVVPATKNSPEIPEHTAVETILNMSPANKAHFKSEKEAIHMILTRIGDEIYSTFLQQLQPEWSRFLTIVKQQHKLDEVSYHKFFDILKQYQKEVNEIRTERIAKTGNLLALVATA
ncbi:hypothetical protein Tco_0675097 [Tanacetum coccineum]